MSESEKYSESLAHVGDRFDRSLCFKDHSPSLPVKILHMIRENDSGNPGTGW